MSALFSSILFEENAEYLYLAFCNKQWGIIAKAFKLAQSKRIISYNPMDDEEIKKLKSEK